MKRDIGSYELWCTLKYLTFSFISLYAPFHVLSTLWRLFLCQKKKILVSDPQILFGISIWRWLFWIKPFLNFVHGLFSIHRSFLNNEYNFYDVFIHSTFWLMNCQIPRKKLSLLCFCVFVFLFVFICTKSEFVRKIWIVCNFYSKLVLSHILSYWSEWMREINKCIARFGRKVILCMISNYWFGQFFFNTYLDAIYERADRKNPQLKEGIQ